MIRVAATTALGCGDQTTSVSEKRGGVGGHQECECAAMSYVPNMTAAPQVNT